MKLKDIFKKKTGVSSKSKVRVAKIDRKQLEKLIGGIDFYDDPSISYKKGSGGNGTVTDNAL